MTNLFHKFRGPRRGTDFRTSGLGYAKVVLDGKWYNIGQPHPHKGGCLSLPN